MLLYAAATLASKLHGHKAAAKEGAEGAGGGGGGGKNFEKTETV